MIIGKNNNDIKNMLIINALKKIWYVDVFHYDNSNIQNTELKNLYFKLIQEKIKNLPIIP